jgi:beta-galactosidase
LPHDWSIEADFSKANPATNQGGALPGGIGWYRKTFVLPNSEAHRNFSVEFDGVYRNSEVWINGHYLGKWAYGYSCFRYELTSYLHASPAKNTIVVKVDNSQQPNSRWYTGSGIYRDVKLISTNDITFDHQGIFVRTSFIRGTMKPGQDIGIVNVSASLRSRTGKIKGISIVHTVYDAAGKNCHFESALWS